MALNTSPYAMKCKNCGIHLSPETMHRDSPRDSGICSNCEVTGPEELIDQLDTMAQIIADALDPKNKQAFLSLRPEALRCLVKKASETGKVTLPS